MDAGVDSWWNALVSVLNSSAVVTERQPCGLVVSADRDDGPAMVVEVVMTEDEWDDLVSIHWAHVEPAAQHVRDLVIGQPRNQRYLVYSQYELVPSATPELPEDPAFLRMQELGRVKGTL